MSMFKNWWGNRGDAQKLESDIQNAIQKNEAYASIGGRYSSPEQRAKDAKAAHFKALAQFISHRREVTRIDFDFQLRKVIQAAKAVEGIKGMEKTLAGDVVLNNLRVKVAELTAMVFAAYDLSPEAAEAYVNALVEAEEKEAEK